MADPEGGAAGAPSPTPSLRTPQFEKQQKYHTNVFRNILSRIHHLTCLKRYFFQNFPRSMLRTPQEHIGAVRDWLRQLWGVGGLNILEKKFFPIPRLSIP